MRDTSPERALLVERNVAEWLRMQAIVPGVELHDDPDITWVVHPGRAWSNAAVMIRLAQSTAASRLDTLVTGGYRKFSISIKSVLSVMCLR